MSSDKPAPLVDDSFASFRAGEPGNAGQNLYVSKAGVLQRIVYTSVTGSGYVDIPFANSHDDNPRVPAYLYTDPLGSEERIELDTDGAFAGVAADLTGNGYDDIIIANQYDGQTNELHAQVYFGSAEGYSGRRMLQLWAPSSKDVEVGRYAPDAGYSIVFVARERLRVFDADAAGEFASRRYVDIALPDGVHSIATADLDGDGVDDLIVRSHDSSVRVFWGGEGGIDPTRFTLLPSAWTGDEAIDAELDTAAMGSGGDTGYVSSTLFVYKPPRVPRLKVVDWRGRPHIFLCPADTTKLVGFDGERTADLALEILTGPAFSAATGDLRGTGETDVVVVTRQRIDDETERSLVYWGRGDGAVADEPAVFHTRSANDVVTADLSGSGRSDVIVCQDRVWETYSTESLVYPATEDGLADEPRRLPTHCAMDVLLVRAPDRPVRPVFLNHLSNSTLGNIDSFIYLGGPEGYDESRRIELRGWAPTELKFIDFLDRGAPDVFMANSNENYVPAYNGSYVYYREGDGFPESRRLELPTRNNMSGVVADLDRDGYLDLITAGWKQDELLIFRGGPDGFTTEPERLRLQIGDVPYNQPRFMTLADLDNDGWLDLVVPELGPDGDLLILWGGPEGFSTDRASVIGSGPVVSSRVADLDGDGWLDLIVGGYRGDDPGDLYRTAVYVYWGGPDGYSNDRRTQLPANFPADVAVADLDNDGNLDIVVANYHGHRTRDLDSYIYWGRPGGRFHPEDVTRLFHHSACGVLAVDLDEDGYVDLVMANHKTYGNHKGDSYIWKNGPQGFSDERRIALPTDGPHGLSHHDIGNVVDRGPEEFFTSRVHVVDGDRVLTGVAWEGDIPEKTWVRAQIRTAESASGLEHAAWQGPGSETDWFVDESPVSIPLGGVVQYRLALGATNGVATPRITQVRLHLG